MQQPFQSGDTVHIKRERGYGDEAFVVLARIDKSVASQAELRLQDVARHDPPFQIYEAHCYATIDDRRQSIQARARARELAARKILSRPRRR